MTDAFIVVALIVVAFMVVALWLLLSWLLLCSLLLLSLLLLLLLLLLLFPSSFIDDDDDLRTKGGMHLDASETILEQSKIVPCGHKDGEVKLLARVAGNLYNVVHWRLLVFN